MDLKDEVFDAMLASGQLDEFLDLIDPQKFDEFSRSVFVELRKAVRALESNADKYYNQSEEQISTTISLLLEKSGFHTKSEPSSRGHVDIFVEKDKFKWLIEAKIGYNNQKIFEGLLQLTSRYLNDQRSACLLLYFKKENIKSNFESWKKYIQNKSWMSYAVNENIVDQCELMYGETVIKPDSFCIGNSFLSDAKTTAGEVLDIYNLGVNLHFCPVDSSGRNGKALKKEQAKIYFEHLFHDRKNGSPIDEITLFSKLNDYFEFEK
ncbi:hypothetical protein ES815_22235 [Leclercia adecarboxylata]|uniref:Uncharacterized protein n=1 Tax=Leclercia adecarboxylata TaxID=83655 RepID=A0AAP9DDK5_9ENTR|nr:hypothetical protein [Leclercia adecarboxylata]QDK20882.1 hypothetical protein ES815_22235 [Leclercia adecarboxylata]